MASIPSTINSAEAAIYQPVIFPVAGGGPCKSWSGLTVATTCLPQHCSKSAACCCPCKLVVLTVESDQQIADASNRYEFKSVLQRRRQESDDWRASCRHGAG